MTPDEFGNWVDFYRLFPFDDRHRYHRPAALIAVSMGGGNVRDKLDWLAPEPVPDGYTQADLNSFKAFGIKPPPRKAK